MKCIFCGCEDSKVIDSRAIDEMNSIKRRRECVNCGKRFTTFETIEMTPVMVVKSNGERQTFSASKIKNGIMRACEKRPVSMKDIDNLVATIEKNVYNSLQEEISSKEIGEMVCDGLKSLDEIAYIRFASVYKQFKDVSTFSEFINDLEKLIKLKEE